jgi:hypothetical protein
MQKYDNQMHLKQNWAQLIQSLGKDAEVQNRQLFCAVQSLVPTKPAYLKATKEAEKEAGEERTRLCTAQLTAQGIIKDLHCQDLCTSCGRILRMEATFRCKECKSLFHVRCLPQEEEEMKYSTSCFTCTQRARAKGKEKADIIEDVMGVCA